VLLLALLERLVEGGGRPAPGFSKEVSATGRLEAIITRLLYDEKLGNFWGKAARKRENKLLQIKYFHDFKSVDLLEMPLLLILPI
jgi:hypothetical protein